MIVKNYKDFISEELNFKKALAGAAIGAGIALGSVPARSQSTNIGNIEYDSLSTNINKYDIKSLIGQKLILKNNSNIYKLIGKPITGSHEPVLPSCCIVNQPYGAKSFDLFYKNIFKYMEGKNIFSEYDGGFESFLRDGYVKIFHDGLDTHGLPVSQYLDIDTADGEIILLMDDDVVLKRLNKMKEEILTDEFNKMRQEMRNKIVPSDTVSIRGAKDGEIETYTVPVYNYSEKVFFKWCIKTKFLSSVFLNEEVTPKSIEGMMSIFRKCIRVDLRDTKFKCTDQIERFSSISKICVVKPELKFIDGRNVFEDIDKNVLKNNGLLYVDNYDFISKIRNVDEKCLSSKMKIENIIEKSNIVFLELSFEKGTIWENKTIIAKFEKKYTKEFFDMFDIEGNILKSKEDKIKEESKKKAEADKIEEEKLKEYKKKYIGEKYYIKNSTDIWICYDVITVQKNTQNWIRAYTGFAIKVKPNNDGRKEIIIPILSSGGVSWLDGWAEGELFKVSDVTFSKKELNLLLSGNFKLGQSESMIVMALGNPDDIDNSVDINGAKTVYNYDMTSLDLKSGFFSTSYSKNSSIELTFINNKLISVVER